ncbi:MAG: hypothetical protein ACI8XM_000072 [Haloarculaceae archaeon]|jgi:hypothetical protein
MDEHAISHQASFDSDGDLVVEGSTETSLDQFGVDVDHRDPDSRPDEPTASEFGVDDRATDDTPSDAGEQVPLASPLSDDQRTLDGSDPPAPYED